MLASIERKLRKLEQARGVHAASAVEPIADFGAWLPVVSPRWCWDWPHLQLIRRHLDQITAGQLKHLALFLPPRHGKSEMTTIRYPVFRLERNPSTRVCVGCYNQQFSDKFGRKARRIARQRLQLSTERSAVREWETEAGGVFRACGVGNPPTGEGFDLLVIDDPIKSREEAESLAYRDRVWDWYTDDLYSRLEPGAAVILIMTRWHVDDLAGRILQSELASDWTFINLPAEAEEDEPAPPLGLGRKAGEALCPERYDKEALASIHKVMGSAYLALYQQRPVPREGALFKRHWWGRYHWMHEHYVLMQTGAQVLPQHCKRVAIMDPAGGTSKGADNTAIAIWDITTDRRAFLRHAFKGRVPVEDIPRKLKEICDVFRPLYCVVEGAFLQSQIVRECRRIQGMPAIKSVDPGGKNKFLRAVPAIVKAEAGELFVPADNEPGCSWLEDWLTEHDQFTGNDDVHDDQVDCTAYMALEMQTGVSAGAMPFSLGMKGQSL